MGCGGETSTLKCKEREEEARAGRDYGPLIVVCFLPRPPPPLHTRKHSREQNGERAEEGILTRQIRSDDTARKAAGVCLRRHVCTMESFERAGEEQEFEKTVYSR